MVSNKHKGFIDAYFQKLKLRPAKDSQEFVNILLQKYDRMIVQNLLNLIAERPTKTLSEDYKDEVYELTNQSLELSIDFTRFNADLYFKYFQWFTELKNKKPQKMLDIGCANGFITCFYGLLFPKSKIVGIDPCEKAIECANKLAKKLKVRNVTFKQTGLLEFADHYPSGNFDLITSVMTFKEIIGSYIQKAKGTLDEFNYWSLRDLNIRSGADNAKKPLDILANLLSENGQFLSFERWFPEDTIWWADKLSHSGLSIDWAKSKTLAFHEIGEPRTFPVMIIDKNFREYDSVERTAVLWLGSKKPDPDKNAEYQNLAAESMFDHIRDKSLFEGVQCEFTDSPLTVRYEFWTTVNKVLCYHYSNAGFRELRIIPLETDDSMNNMVSDLMKYLSQYGYRISKYSSVEEREALT